MEKLIQVGNTLMEEITAFKTIDGQIFDKLEEATYHEKTLPRPREDVQFQLDAITDVINESMEIRDTLRAELETHKKYRTCRECNGTGGESVYTHDCWGNSEYSHTDNCDNCGGTGKVEL